MVSPGADYSNDQFQYIKSRFNGFLYYSTLYLWSG